MLENNKDKLVWDSQINKEYKITDISKEKLIVFTKQINLPFTTKEEVLKKLGLVKNRMLTNASIILFAKDSTKYFRLLNLRCAVFSGTDKASKIIDMNEFNGYLFELIEEAQKYILKNIHTGMRLDGLRRVDIPEINKDAIREAIINAFCHRDYTIPQEVQVAVFKDRIEIINPGTLYANLTIKDILTKKYLREEIHL